MRKQIIKDIYDILKPLFNSGYINYIPPISKIREFPSFALTISDEKLERVNITGCLFNIELNISCIVYYKNKDNDYSNDISDLIESIISTINDNSDLNNTVIDCYVNKVVQDGGVIHPFSVAELNIKVLYRK